MILYHTTTRRCAAAIISGDGFRDTMGSYGMGRTLIGVWLSDQEMTINEGCKGNTVIEVKTRLTESGLAEFEVIVDGKPYREWLIPADVINATSTLRQLTKHHTLFQAAFELVTDLEPTSLAMAKAFNENPELSRAVAAETEVLSELWKDKSEEQLEGACLLLE